MKDEKENITDNLKPPDNNFLSGRVVSYVPYYEDEYTTIYNEDCLIAMQALRPFTIITDPPYGIAYKDKDNKVMIGDYANVLGRALKPFYESLCDDGAIFIFTSFKLLSDWLYRFEMYFKMNNLIIWEKERSTGLYGGSNFGYSYEMIFYGSKGGHKLLEPEDDVLGCRRVSARKREHPTQKPIDLLKRIIQVSTPQDGLILDPFMGSGSTLVAAKQLGRKAVGIELNPKYCDVAIDRLRQTAMMLK